MITRHKIIVFSTGFWLFFLLMTASANAYEFPPYKGIELKVTGDITGNYTNNVTYASADENKIEDFRTMLNLGLNFKYSGKRRFVNFSGLVKRQVYETSSNIQNPSENVKLSYRENLTKYDSITLSDNYTHTQEPGSGTGDFDMEECRQYYRDYGYSVTKIESTCNEFQSEFGRFKGRFDSYTSTLSFNYNKNFSEAFRLTANYSYGQNWSDAEGTNNSDRNRFGLSANYRYSEATNFLLSYSHQLSNFDRGDDITSRSINVGIGQSITKRLYFDLNVGKDTVSSGNDTMSLGATLRSEIDKKTSARLSYSEGVQINANTYDTFKYWQLTGSLSSILLEDLKSSLSAFYGKGNYSSSTISDTFLGASGNLSYNFWQSKRGSSMSGILGYSYSNLASSDKNREYTRNSINTSLTLAF